MLKLFAFVSCLIRIFGRGLQTFKLGRYRQLNKRIGRMIRYSKSAVTHLLIALCLGLSRVYDIALVLTIAIIWSLGLHKFMIIVYITAADTESLTLLDGISLYFAGI